MKAAATLRVGLSAGNRIGPSEILTALGAGGMGKVYRARETKLQRDVALKVLSESFSIYGFEESDVAPALVMELVDGETLAGRLARGPIALDEALPIARQIADALEAARGRQLSAK